MKCSVTPLSSWGQASVCLSAGFLCSLIRYGYNRDGYDRSGYDHAGINAAGVFRFAEKTSKAVTSKKPAQ